MYINIYDHDMKYLRTSTCKLFIDNTTIKNNFHVFTLYDLIAIKLDTPRLCLRLPYKLKCYSLYLSNFVYIIDLDSHFNITVYQNKTT